MTFLSARGITFDGLVVQLSRSGPLRHPNGHPRRQIRPLYLALQSHFLKVLVHIHRLAKLLLPHLFMILLNLDLKRTLVLRARMVGHRVGRKFRQCYHRRGYVTSSWKLGRGYTSRKHFSAVTVPCIGG